MKIEGLYDLFSLDYKILNRIKKNTKPTIASISVFLIY